MNTTERRHDIDWLRVIAIFLLVLYHLVIGFQPWGLMFGFIGNSTPLTALWIPMTAINIWRIPLLFFVSGMGVYFALRSRSVSALLKDRFIRIAVPLLFGAFTIVPLQLWLLRTHYDWKPAYTPEPAHLWFLGNIMLYVLLLTPLMLALKRHPGGRFAQTLQRMAATPWLWLMLTALFLLEAATLNPQPFELYALTLHGFLFGALAFLSGFLMLLGGAPVHNSLQRLRWVFLAGAVILFAYRTLQFPETVPAWQLMMESLTWIAAVLAFAARHLNRPSRILTYLSSAVYPVYILHMVFQAAASMLIFPLELPAPVKFALVLTLTLTASFLTCELLLRRIWWLGGLFGTGFKKNNS
jgi:peptidoglycan/LPS O-acetylase OafA/YrhL